MSTALLHANALAKLATMRKALDRLEEKLGGQAAPARPVGAKLGRIVDVVADVFEMPRHRLVGRNQQKAVCEPRYAVMHIAAKAGFGIAEIGRQLDMHHTTVLHGRERCKALAAQSEQFREKLAACEARLRGQA